MSEVERAQNDARFGIIMSDLARDSIFMWYYEKLEEHDKKDN
jgi:hypothetical protein